MDVQDRLEGLTERLAALEHAPVSEHPEVLEAVQRALVAELDAVAHRPQGRHEAGERRRS